MMRSTLRNCAADTVLPWVAALGLLWLLGTVGLSACKNERATSDQGSGSEASVDVASPKSAADRRATSPERYRPDDGTAAGRALGILAAIELPTLEGEQCSEYAANTRTLFTDLGYQLRHLRQLDQQGMSHRELGSLAAWLDARAGMLEQMARSKSMPEGELRRRHLEFTGSVADLVNAFGAAYGQEGEPEPESAGRLANAADNFAAALASLGALCSGSSDIQPQTPPQP